MGFWSPEYFGLLCKPRTISDLRPRTILWQEPGPALGLVNPGFDQAGSGTISRREV